MPNDHAATKDEMTANQTMAAWQLTRTVVSNGGTANNKCARQTKKCGMASKIKLSMDQTNEDVVKGQPTIVPTKSRCDDRAIKKCTRKMRNGSMIMNKNGGKSKQHQLGD
jgi:hypothetical protein